MMFGRKLLLRRGRVAFATAFGLALGGLSLTLTSEPASATLHLLAPDASTPATFFGHGGYSTDGLGQNFETGGTVQAEVPAGSSVVRAYLYGTYFGAPDGGPDLANRTIDFDGTAVELQTLPNSEPGGASLYTARAQVTTQVAAKVGTGGGITDFAVNSDPELLDGVALVVVYSNPASPEVTIAVLDGGSKQAGDTVTYRFATPVDPRAPGFVAQLSLGSGFSYQGVDGHACGGGQYSEVRVNGDLLTECAGNYDDGVGNDGALITVGGVGDSTDNPAQTAGEDDELYNLVPLMDTADTSLTIDTANPSGDDNLFLAVIAVSAEGTVTTEVCDNGVDDDGDGLTDAADPDCQGGGPDGDDEADTDEDVPAEIFVLTNDPPPPGVGLWEVTAVTQPANGLVEINDEVDPEVEDTVVFTPARDFFGSTSFTYTVDDGDGHTATHTVLVTVGPINDEPVVSTGADVSTAEGGAVQVSGSATDVDGPLPLAYNWVVLDGPEVTVEPNGTFADEESPTTLFTPKQDGVYLLQLEACDTDPGDPRCDTDTADDTVTVTVGNVAPTVSLPANRTVSAGTSTSLTVSFTDPGADDAHTATVDWGDGSPVATVDPAASPFTTSHTYTTTGVRTVQVCVSDGVDETCESMTITVVNPVTLSIGDVAIDEPDSATAPLTFTITASPTPTATVTVVAKTVNGSATAPSDYTALPAAGQTVTFAAGQATRTVTVPIVGDLLREPNESFTVTLSTPVGATIGDGSALGRIRNHTDECTVLGTAGNDTLNGGAGNDVICGLGGDDTINGNAGNDTILAGDGGDTIRGGAGNDIIRGHAGNDVITGEAGNDVIDGGAGSDEASWAGAPNAVTVDLTANTATGWGTDTLANMERARGSNFNDTIRGNGLANMLWGAGGNDTLAGRSANDRLEGQAGDDTLRGEAGNDTALGGDGNDQVDGGAGADLVKGDAGNDQVAGGAGNDNSPDGTTAGVHGGTGTNNLNGGLGTDYCSRGTGDTRTRCERP